MLQIQHVIPPLMTASKKRGGDDFMGLRVLKIFVDALVHIPAHRRVRLFTALIETMGAEQYLSAACVMMLSKRYTSHSGAEGEMEDGKRVPGGSQMSSGALVDFYTSLSQQFTVDEQVCRCDT